MRRAAALSALLIFGLLALPSVALAAPAKWSAVSTSTAFRYGYTSPAPEAFRAKLVSAIGAFVGPSFDASSALGAWSYSAETNANGYTSDGLNDAKDGATIYTAVAGQDFAVVQYFGLYKDWRQSIPGGGSGQYLLPKINNVAVLGQSMSLSYFRRSDVLGNDTQDPWGGYGIAHYSSAGLAASEASKTMPASRYQTVRGFYTVSGVWNASAGAWRVRTKVAIDDGSTNRQTYSRETTYSAAVVSSYFLARGDGYNVEASTDSQGRRQVTRVKDSGVTLTNVEFAEAAVSTDTAEVARIYAKSVTLGAVDAEPTGYWDVDTDGDTSGEDETSLLGLTFGGWKKWFSDNVTRPVTDAFANVTDLLWFVDPLKEWFGVGN